MVAGRNAVLEAMKRRFPSRPRTWQRAPNATTASVTFSSSLRADEGCCSRSPGVSWTGSQGVRYTKASRCSCRHSSMPTPMTCWPRLLDSDHTPLIVALDSITNPRNLGAIVRSAAAFGAHGVLIAERRWAGMTAAAWKTSAGAAAHIPIARATNLNRSLRDYADA